MPIRPAALSDAPGIIRLLTQLEYPGTQDFLEIRLAALLRDPEEILLVWEEPGNPPQVMALLSLHFIPQIALRGDFGRISYFVVDDSARGQGIGQQMEAEATRLAREHGCALLEVHCHSRRTQAHEFYARQGYIESPKYLIKNYNKCRQPLSIRSRRADTPTGIEYRSETALAPGPVWGSSS